MSGLGNVWPLPMFPTAQQLLEEAQLTSSRVALDTDGDATEIHLDPSQCRVSPVTLLFISCAAPTAQQSAGDTQLTPESQLYGAGCGRLEADAVVINTSEARMAEAAVVNPARATQVPLGTRQAALIGTRRSRRRSCT
jgi:hypothetical protein